jgi:ankyrin repeat protein
MPYSFLHIAALRNDIDSARKHIEGGGPDTVHVWDGMPSTKITIDPIDVDVRDHQGWTPLMIAASHGNTEMCKFLIDSKAIVHKKKNFAATSLHLACRGIFELA